MWIASDTCVTDSSGADELSEPKIAYVSGWAICVAGEAWALTAIRHRLKLKRTNVRDVVKYASTTLADALRKAFHRHAGAVPESEYLIARSGHLIMADSNMCMIRSVNPYNAIGSGTTAARASLHTTQALVDGGAKLSPESRLELALQAASDICPGVGGKVFIHRY